jgi:hypothetical protein
VGGRVDSAVGVAIGVAGAGAVAFEVAVADAGGELAIGACVCVEVAEGGVEGVPAHAAISRHAAIADCLTVIRSGYERPP